MTGNIATDSYAGSEMPGTIAIVVLPTVPDQRWRGVVGRHLLERLKANG
jgi:hypothetical protein